MSFIALFIEIRLYFQNEEVFISMTQVNHCLCIMMKLGGEVGYVTFSYNSTYCQVRGHFKVITRSCQGQRYLRKSSVKKGYLVEKGH